MLIVLEGKIVIANGQTGYRLVSAAVPGDNFVDMLRKAAAESRVYLMLDPARWALCQSYSYYVQSLVESSEIAQWSDDLVVNEQRVGPCLLQSPAGGKTIARFISPDF